MSSIIVLDSSEEDEAPEKKPKTSRAVQIPLNSKEPQSIPATTANAVKLAQKSRILPSGITVTRHSPITVNSTNNSSPIISSNLLSASANNVSKPQPTSLPKINAAFLLSASDRETPTPPRHQLEEQKGQMMPGGQRRGRVTPSPPQQPLISPPAFSPGLPMMSLAQSMTAGATPPLQLLATPPHSSGLAYEQLMIDPHLIHSSLPKSTTITTQFNPSYSAKMQLPAKRAASRPSPGVSPVQKLSPPPPAPLHSPQFDVVAASMEKVIRRIKPTTVLKNSDEAWLQRQRQGFNDDTVVETFPSTSISPKATSTLPAMAAKSSNSPKTLTPPQTPIPTKLDQRESVTCTPLDLTHSHIDTTSAAAALVKLNGDPLKSVPVITPPSDGPLVEEAFEDIDNTYAELLKVCREADSTPDMEKLIQTKLIKYYHAVHPDFVKSRGFRKNVQSVIDQIRADKELVYCHLRRIVDELNVRRKSKSVVINNEDAGESTGNKRTDEQIKKLNKALYILTKRIEILEQADVDLDDEDSTFLQMTRFKKRACQIYEKICDLTGESKNAHRMVRKPIQFSDTNYPHFNKTLQAFINRTKEFPDFFDVLRMLEHCNKQYCMGLVNFELKRIAYDAFIKVGKLLQSRRKTDLYENLNYYTEKSRDPASSDPELMAKLSDNQKHQSKINEIIEKYARDQDLTIEEQKEARLQVKLKSSRELQNISEPDRKGGVNGTNETNEGEENDTEDEDSEEEDAGNDLDDDVEILANDVNDLSEVDSDTADNSGLHTRADRKVGRKQTSGGANGDTSSAAVSPKTQQQQGSGSCDRMQNNSLENVDTSVATRAKTGKASQEITTTEHNLELPNGKVKAKESVAPLTVASNTKMVSVFEVLEEGGKLAESVHIDNKPIRSELYDASTPSLPKRARSPYTVQSIVISDISDDEEQS